MRCKFCKKSKGGYLKPYHINCKISFENGVDKIIQVLIKKLQSSETTKGVIIRDMTNICELKREALSYGR